MTSVVNYIYIYIVFISNVDKKCLYVSVEEPYILYNIFTLTCLSLKTYTKTVVIILTESVIFFQVWYLITFPGIKKTYKKTGTIFI